MALAKSFGAVTAVIIIGLNGSPVAARRISAPLKTALCEVAIDARSRLGRENADDPTVVAAIDAVHKSVRTQDLSRHDRCPVKTIRLAYQLGDYITGAGLSADGRQLVVAGGWQYGSLSGGDGFCVYEHREQWQIVGCLIEGVS